MPRGVRRNKEAEQTPRDVASLEQELQQLKEQQAALRQQLRQLRSNGVLPHE